MNGNRDFRKTVINIVKAIGKELQERAEEYIPDTEYTKDIDIWIRICNDGLTTIPEIQVNVTGYPRPVTLEYLLDAKQELLDCEEEQQHE